MPEKRYYWMKFRRDFFTSLRIKKLRKLAGGDTYTIIYLKMQLLSIVTDGHLAYKGICNSFSEEIAMDIDEEHENVQITIAYLLESGLMEQDGDDYYLPYAAENVGSETANAQRIRRCRERKKELEQKNISNEIEVKRLRNVEKEIEKEKKIYKRKFAEGDLLNNNYDFDSIERIMEGEQ